MTACPVIQKLPLPVHVSLLFIHFMEWWREEVVAEARGWLGTRFAHQGRRKKSADNAGGVDCLGLVLGVAQACFSSLHEHWANVDDIVYSKQPNAGVLVAGLERHLHPVRYIQQADVGLFRFDGNPQHLAIFTEYAGGGLGLIHAYAPARRVVEHAYDACWRKRLVSVYGFVA